MVGRGIGVREGGRGEGLARVVLLVVTVFVMLGKIRDPFSVCCSLYNT